MKNSQNKIIRFIILAITIVIFIIINFLAHKNMFHTFNLYPYETSVMFSTFMLNKLYWWPMALLKGDPVLHFNDIEKLSETSIAGYFGPIPYAINLLYFAIISFGITFVAFKLILFLINKSKGIKEKLDKLEK